MIDVYVSTIKGLREVTIPCDLFLELAKSLRTKEYETIHTTEESMVIDGIYIANKNNPRKVILIQGDVDKDITS